MNLTWHFFIYKNCQNSELTLLENVYEAGNCLRLDQIGCSDIEK